MGVVLNSAAEEHDSNSGSFRCGNVIVIIERQGTFVCCVGLNLTPFSCKNPTR